MEYRGGFTYTIKKGCESVNNADKIRSMSDEELAKALDVVPSTISNWETGKTKPCKKHRSRLRAALHVTEEQLQKELE